MGCAGSRSVKTVNGGSSVSIRSKASHKSYSNNSTELNNRKNSNSNGKNIKNNYNNNTHKNSVDSLTEELTLQIINDLEPNVISFGDSSSGFSSRDTDSAVDNAKPRLARSGFRRPEHFGPVIPGEKEEDITFTSRVSLTSATPSFTTPTAETPHKEEGGTLLHDSHNAGDVIVESRTEGRSLPDSGLGLLTSESRANSDRRTPQRLQVPSAPPTAPSLSSREGRPYSGRTSSILTTSGLNASIVTSQDGTQNGDLSFDIPLYTPFTEITDLDESTFRTLSITPSVTATSSAEPQVTDRMHEKGFFVIKEESEVGYTPRSISSTKANEFSDQMSRLFLPREVEEHNTKAGWREWSIHKGKVYDMNVIIKVFTPILEEVKRRKAEERQQREEERQAMRKERQKIKDDDDDETITNTSNEDSDGDSYDDFSSSFSDDSVGKDDFSSRKFWRYGSCVRTLQRNGVDSETIQSYLPSCYLGQLEMQGGQRYWADIRSDVKQVLDDLIREDMLNKLSGYRAEYMGLLQRWINKFRDHNPTPVTPITGNPNESHFPLPQEVAENPQVLRAWSMTWQPFDMDVPEDGAWEMSEEQTLELEDSHLVFTKSLRSHIDLSPLDTEVEGEAGWKVIQPGLFADDVLTHAQLEVERQRQGRTDLEDRGRMKRRRRQLLGYFMRKYEMDSKAVNHFLEWAVAMEEGEKRFQELCGQN